MIKLIKNFRRQDFLSLLIFIGISIILYRCITLQYLETEKWSSNIEAREIKPHKIVASRGLIVDRNNEILAESILLETLGTTDPKFFLENNSEKDIKHLCNIIDKNYAYTEFVQGDKFLGKMLYDMTNDKKQNIDISNLPESKSLIKTS